MLESEWSVRNGTNSQPLKSRTPELCRLNDIESDYPKMFRGHGSRGHSSSVPSQMQMYSRPSGPDPVTPPACQLETLLAVLAPQDISTPILMG